MSFFDSSIVIGFLVTLVVGVVIIVTQRYHGAWSFDQSHGIQKFHATPTPRIGGLAIFAGLLSGMCSDWIDQKEALWPILAGATVPFIFGLREDLFKRSSVRQRMLAIIVGSVVTMVISRLYLNRTDVSVLDSLMAFLPLAILVTIFAVTGMTNAINILDGFNGLASGTCIYMACFMGALAVELKDTQLFEMSVMVIAVLLAFIILNFPFGKIFLGDSGAYLLGFSVAWLAVAMIARNDQVSPWALLVIGAYPVVEVLYSMNRRIRARVAATAPDNLHLHTLIKTRVIRRLFPSLPNWLRNSMVAPTVWFPNIILGLLGYNFYDETTSLQIIFVCFSAVYILTHKILMTLPEPEMS